MTDSFDAKTVRAWAEPAQFAVFTQAYSDDAPTVQRLAVKLVDACAEVERLRTSLAEAEHNVRALRAECARLGAAACDAKWDLMP